MKEFDLITHTSTAELERRWAAVRAAMKDNGLEALVMQGRDDWLGGYVRWFTDVWAVNGYPRTVIFYADRPMTIVEMGPFDGRINVADDDPVNRGVACILSTPSFFSVGYSPRYDAELVAGDLKVKPRQAHRTADPGQPAGEPGPRELKALTGSQSPTQPTWSI